MDEQVNILDEELARYPDVIAIASIDENESAVQFDLAVSMGYRSWRLIPGILTRGFSVRL